MAFELAPLPYSKEALEKHISAGTVDVHYERHHRGYVDKLNSAVEGTPDARKDLESLIKTASGTLFNLAAQVWNHTFYWHSMASGGGGPAAGEIAQVIEHSFRSYDSFAQQFAQAANGQFGSGWAWIVDDGTDRLRLLSTSNADTPVRMKGITPLLTIDVWEHAYYLDYRNERDTYVQRFIEHLINWNFVADNLKAARSS